MKNRYWLYRRNGVFYLQDAQTRQRESLHTTNRTEAERLRDARNQVSERPNLGIAMAKAYLTAHDPQIAVRTWQNVLDEFSRRGKPFEISAGWLQMANPIFVITLAPVVAAAWLTLARRGRHIPLPAKFAIGLLLLALGFLVMAGAAGIVASGNNVLPTWLITTYLFHSLGELCISPVGLSSVTKLAPQRLLGQMMGLWFLATSLGNLIAGLAAGRLTSEDPSKMPLSFLVMVGAATLVGLVVLGLTKPIKKLMAGVE